jgi:hypothetical protein
MTAEELQAHRDSARAALSRDRGGWRFSAEALAEAGAGAGPPFAVVAAATVDRRVGQFWPVRAYPWGRCESLLAAHSELPALRRLLFEAAYWELKANTEAQYLQYRRQEAKERANPVSNPVPVRTAPRERASQPRAGCAACGGAPQRLAPAALTHARSPCALLRLRSRMRAHRAPCSGCADACALTVRRACRRPCSARCAGCCAWRAAWRCSRPPPLPPSTWGPPCATRSSAARPCAA